jgi:hypothetical protein
MTKFKELFSKDLEKIYLLLQENQNELNSFYKILEDDVTDKREFIDNFLKDIKLPINKETRLSAINRLVSLRDESLVQELQKANFSEEEIDVAKEKAYLWASGYHLKLHEKLLYKIDSLKLLTPFYRTILHGVHEAGIAFTKWQSSWTSHIITGVNRELFRLFEGDEERIYQMLAEKNLFDKDEEGKAGDRSYSVLAKKDGSFCSVSYKEAFPKEVENVTATLKTLVLKLSVLEDEIYELKDEYIKYFEAIIEALNEIDTAKLIKRWADVDRAWMKITSPLQVGHPLEYYEDHYRKAVALEWDVRIANPKENEKSDTQEKVKDTFLKLFDTLASQKQQNIKTSTLKNLDKVQLYIGKPMLYYGAEFCGLFSAQVVPNDEKVSSEFGKKIFAFSDSILEAQKAKPTLKITQIVFGDEFIKEQKDLLFNKPEIWHRIYDITTIGHEFGHILWMDGTSEKIMNKTGNFKNIEEFKATTGGLVSFFYNEEEKLKSYILKDVTKRAISLIAWMQTGEVEPYYCEGLIHIDILFKSGVLRFDGKTYMDFSDKAYEKTVSLYKSVYNDLAKHYLAKKDATLFLQNFAKKENGYFLPVDKKVKSFVEYYWELYKKIGREVV